MASHRFDPNFTQNVIDGMGPNTTPRNRQVLGALIRHIHDFAREVELTMDEWMAGVKYINEVGRVYSESGQTRNEAHRLSDILGLETLVDEIAHKIVVEEGLEPTSSSILGPFWSPNAPFRENGGSIIQDGVPPKGRVTKMHGVIRDITTGKPIPNAVFDIWQASANGKYDFQDPQNQTPNNLRGKFKANEKGEYWFYCLHPTAYSLPTDGPSYALLQLMDRHPMRPAHIHIMVTHPEYQGCTTQLYPSDDPWITNDTVFAVKDDLVVTFKPIEGDEKAVLELEYNVNLAPKGFKGKV
ncbi:aromatic compound dioxygenase [Neurospora crassa]|uniref:Catechol dioxygenase n=2 Tax=Neurospora TaxID=5140 RepID=Q7RZE7_NEUCR|nr:catechol dioxygenase [Neurospora crassa OR74A]EAA28451.1 catechol dioxygenase [Neurospora crassa OR74A]KHE81870.1 aromatic compound dioxygenase [Neurospora crassa]|eukprot:XP_957687.1 catechol dioxygenase [Neurospora crassa OR74A]